MAPQTTADHFQLNRQHFRITPPDGGSQRVFNGGAAVVLYTQGAIFSLDATSRIAPGASATFTSGVWIAAENNTGANVIVTTVPKPES